MVSVESSLQDGTKEGRRRKILANVVEDDEDEKEQDKMNSSVNTQRRLSGDETTDPVM